MSVHGAGLHKGFVNQEVFSLGKQIGQSEHVEILLKMDVPAYLGQRRSWPSRSWVSSPLEIVHCPQKLFAAANVSAPKSIK